MDEAATYEFRVMLQVGDNLATPVCVVEHIDEANKIARYFNTAAVDCNKMMGPSLSVRYFVERVVRWSEEPLSLAD